MRRRRTAAIAVTLAGLLTLAACGGGDAGQSPRAGGTKKVEVFSWWTGPGEADGLKAMKEIFEERNAGLEFFDAAVAGGSGDKARALLATKLQAATPPDTFQGHAGAELRGYIKAGQLEPVDFLYDELGLRRVLPRQLVDQISVDGRIYSIPVNIHRSNVMWFSPAVLRKAGVTEVPTTIDGFVAALEKVRKTGETPLAIGSEWTMVHLLESVLLGSLGTDAYNALWTSASDWSGPAMTKALNAFKTIMSYAGEPADDWQPAAKQVAEGQAGFTIMGDWAYGYFHNPPDGGLGKRSRIDFDWAPSPGTGGTFMWLSDSFALPKGAANRAGAVAWLKVAASKEGQDAFNPLKGSIPARKDADASLYTGYLAGALKDWRGDRLAGSVQHGVTVNDAWRVSINEAVGMFHVSGDVAELQSALTEAARGSGQ